ncbi:twin-arginine translocase subunit TatC [Roseivirga thermotolerans]|uniref:Sec-independent protein translocase protein TatC n=1 Tax=Roseivirga thermotolerans TaxID=1758176 RepID=A0ABQ3I3T4_9BACT|nr:twin-arginine translocase subunit TatC [Roseivirga thermotolerans]GHE54670.1 Sec-independent protein translocase protein TatC [Roseivirga thermotolerans]
MALDQLHDDDKEMGFLDHLEELRWHLVRSVVAIVVFSVAAFLAKDFVWKGVILAPIYSDFWTYKQLCYLAELFKTPVLCLGDIPIDIQNRTITGQFTMHIKSSLVIGLVLAFPYAFWEIWRFVKPGLRHSERSASRGVVLAVSFLFITGVLFGYYIVTPLSLNFLGNYSLVDSIDNNIDITSILNTIATLVLACGFMFQLPMATYILSKAGIVTPDLMKRYRRHSIVVILLLSAIITPPDVMSQILIALPLSLLYEISIVISKRINKKRERELYES